MQGILKPACEEKIDMSDKVSKYAAPGRPVERETAECSTRIASVSRVGTVLLGGRTCL